MERLLHACFTDVFAFLQIQIGFASPLELPLSPGWHLLVSKMLSRDQTDGSSPLSSFFTGWEVLN
jgi:hypothetical protein